MKALVITNQSADAKGLLPPSTCKQDNSAQVTCTAPAPGISEVEFHTYPNLTALYNAYMAEVTSLSSPSQFKQNYRDCGLGQTVGEVGWNHQFQHPKTYTVAEMSAGRVTDDQAAGRVFCNNIQGLEYMVWTQDDGHVLGVVVGAPHENVWNWWVAVHHNIGLSSIGQVTITADAAQNANASSVAGFLDSYFTAINTHDYQSYISLLSPALRQGLTAEQFSLGYKSVVDSAETLVSISLAPN